MEIRILYSAILFHSQDVTQTRKDLVRQNRERFGNRYLFDGASIYLTKSLPEFVIDTTHDAKPMKISVRPTGLVDSTNSTAFQLFNLIFREAMAGLKLQNIRRDYFDPQAKVNCTEILFFLEFYFIIFFS
jgi:hypothetical protein